MEEPDSKRRRETSASLPETWGHPKKHFPFPCMSCSSGSLCAVFLKKSQIFKSAHGWATQKTLIPKNISKPVLPELAVRKILLVTFAFKEMLGLSKSILAPMY